MQAHGEKVLAVGINDNGELVRNTFGDPIHDWYGFPDTEMSPIFPAGIVGIKDKGSNIYDLIYNSICLHHPVIPKDNYLGRDSSDGICMGWCMLPIYLARMGMSELLVNVLNDTISSWIFFPNGLGNYGSYDSISTGVNGLKMRWGKNTLQNTDTCETSEAFAWNFRHFNYETLPIISAAVNEMLIQSYDGVIRLFCAVKHECTYVFSLAVSGGFTVDSVYSNGACEVNIKAERLIACIWLIKISKVIT